MKRIMTLVLAACFAFGSMGVANAQSGVDVKVKGAFDFTFGWAEMSFKDSRKMADDLNGRNDDNFIAAQRVRTQINFIASENLQGVLFFEIGVINWGNNNGNGSVGRGSGGSLAADGVNIETRRAYIDWMVPDTGLSIRMGIQGLTLPTATDMGVILFDNDVAAITASYAFNDTFSLTAFWARPFNQNITDGGRKSWDDEMDMFALVLPITLDGASITPWFLWANIGSASGFHAAMLDTDEGYRQNDSAAGWWAGIATSVDLFDPLTFAFDVVYGDVNKVSLLSMENEWYNESKWGARGWAVDARLDYAFDFGTLGIFGWWSTGDSKAGLNAGRLGRMPSGFFSDTGFGPTSFGWDNGFGMGNQAAAVGYGIAGTWGIGIQLADFSFIEDLSHTLRFAYYTGTNDKDIIKAGIEPAGFGSLYLTDGDHAWEINFDHTYQIYENLTMALELGYIHLDLDKVWNGSDTWGTDKTSDAWKAQIHFNYSF